MYTCPICGERFELCVEGKAETVVTLTVVHDHEQGMWRAVARAKGERQSPSGKDITAKNYEMKKVARVKTADEKRQVKNAAHVLPWPIDPKKTYLGEDK